VQLVSAGLSVPNRQVLPTRKISNCLKYFAERPYDCLGIAHIVLVSSNFPEQILNLLAFFSRPGSINFDGLAASLVDFPSFPQLLEEFEHCQPFLSLVLATNPTEPAVPRVNAVGTSRPNIKAP
jgi:hypothetical protein